MTVATERWALVLGCSAGTGAAVARALARDPGLHVFGFHRGHFPAEARALEDELRAVGRKVVFRVADVGTADGVREGAAAVHDALGPARVAFMVHALSGASLGRFLATPERPGFHPRQFEKTFNYLAHSFAYWAQALHEGGLLAPGARLLGLTNMLHDSLVDTAGLIAACKAALEMYVRYFALELGPHGHRVNLLKFGTVPSPALARVFGPESLARLEAQARDLIPAGRLCSFDDVGRVVSYLARPESEWFNGATIDFSGGMALHLLEIVTRPG